MKNRKWVCPICRMKTFDMVVDGYLDSILKDIKNNNRDVVEVVFNKSGGY